MSSFNDRLITLLKKDTDFLDEENNVIKNEVINKAWKADQQLIGLLIEDEDIKAKFFSKIKDCYVFDINTFTDYIQDKHFLNDSYTKYKNKIGLNIDGKFLNERKEVALVWPYKDCILEGGQSKEDQKRKEIFFNEILAQDDIDRLLDPKVLTNFKRYTVDGAQNVTELKRDERGTIKENLIIKGNNLLALHSLKQQFQGKVRLIYIDPPYNTENDSFNYNDNFNHSTWLTFMKNRLEVAKVLLKDDGVIFVQCDDNEQAYLKVLMDEVFGRSRFVNTIAIKMSEASGTKMSHVNSRFPKIKEYIHLYRKNRLQIDIIDYISKDKWDSEYKTIIEEFTIEDRQIIKNIQEKNINNKDDVAIVQNIFNKIKLSPLHKYKNFEDSLEWKKENAFRIIRTVSSDSLRNIVKSYKSLPKSELGCGLSNDNLIFFYNTASNLASQGRIRVVFSDDFLQKHPCDMWYDIKTTGIANEGSVKLNFGKKPEKILERIIKMTTNPNDVILDYHLGSGTTCAVAHKMGRQYIGIEQLDYGENDSVVRLQNVIGKKIKKDGQLIETLEHDQSGISKAVNWQGGGGFIYCELAKYNQTFIDHIQEAKTSDTLLKIWEAMKERSFLNYNVDIKEQDKRIDEFKTFSLNQQKQLLLEMLNKNQLYVNLSEIDDTEFKISDEDKALNKAFYGERR